MSPSRGPPAEPIAPPSPSVNTDTDTKANLRSSSALASAKRNIHFLFSPNSPSSPRPAHLRTRALLRSLRYIGIFVFWRVVRYARYALVGSLVAAVGASAFGGAVSGAAFLLAPPTLVTSVGIGLVWAAGKWGFRRMRRGEGEKEVGDRDRDRKGGSGVDVDGQWRDVQGPRAVPW